MRELTIPTGTRAELVDITPHVREAVHDSGIVTGMCYLFVPHTTAGLTLNENWDPSVRSDILRALDRLVPSSGAYRHAEGNSPAHIKASLTGFDLALLVDEGDLVLGTWQGVYLAEFDGPRRRRVLVRVVEA
ncbi:MAG TPA: YjbQ family protein [Chloroflexi bacterium]|jgi:secondary thiamine-phosphate synthase enzyme|nr:YjbQ family protein [Chloroflexota bacterium]